MRPFRVVVFTLLVAGIPLLASAQPVTQPFTFSPKEHTLPMVRHGSLSWGDIDGDLDLDVFLSGETKEGLVSGIYLNQGTDSNGKALFQPITISIPGLVYSFSSWADYDGDGDLDLLVAGSTRLAFPYLPKTFLYRNEGNNTFALVEAGFPGLHSGSSSWGDLDRDGDLDLILTGVDENDKPVSVIAMNNGGAGFSLDLTALPGYAYGDSALGDIDNDGDLDLVLSGSGANGFRTRLYRNNAGQFTEVETELGSLVFSTVDLGDYDNDGDLDLIVSGGAISENLMSGKTFLWKNSQGSFSPVSQALDGVLAGDVSWGDFDNDGDLDLFFLGASEVLGSRDARIYRNEGQDTFLHISNLVGSVFSDMEWGDFDADGDLDLIASGFTPYAQTTTALYVNHRQVRPTIPSAPKGLETVVSPGTVELRWARDLQADPANSYGSFNVRVGTGPGLSDVVAPMADSKTGMLSAPRLGNAASTTGFTLENLSDGTYFWSVQTINHALMASGFAAEGTFSVSGSFSTESEVDAELPNVFALRGIYPNPFSVGTQIEFDLPEPSSVTMRVFSVLGREVAQIQGGMLGAGTHRLGWSGMDAAGLRLGSGLYFVEIRAGNLVKTGSVTLLR